VVPRNKKIYHRRKEHIRAHGDMTHSLLVFRSVLATTDCSKSHRHFYSSNSNAHKHTNTDTFKLQQLLIISICFTSACSCQGLHLNDDETEIAAFVKSANYQPRGIHTFLF